jgi:hypothetical protein
MWGAHNFNYHLQIPIHPRNCTPFLFIFIICRSKAQATIHFVACGVQSCTFLFYLQWLGSGGLTIERGVIEALRLRLKIKRCHRKGLLSKNMQSKKLSAKVPIFDV